MYIEREEQIGRGIEQSQLGVFGDLHAFEGLVGIFFLLSSNIAQGCLPSK